MYGESVDKIVQGNANWVNAKLATPTGWRLMKDIRVGDEVFTPDGTITKVLGVYPKGVRPVYKVTLRDGSSTLVCNQHLWEIERWKSAIKYTGEKDANGHRAYVGTGENGKTMKAVSEVIDTDELKVRVDKGELIWLPAIRPVVYPEKDLLIDPYVLGVILGDANVDAKGHATLSCDDVEIIKEIESRGYKVTLNHESEDVCPCYYVCDVCDKLRELGLAGHRSWEKFVPEDYLFASVEQRIDLLRGLMDTDGTISEKSEMEFTSSSETLANHVQELIRSLGGRVPVNVKDKVFYTSPNQPDKKKARPAYRVQNIRLPEINPFLLKRKAERWHDRDKNHVGNYGNRVVSVEYMFDDEVQCILVEDDRHLFIVDDYIPTHNTSNIVFLKSTDDSMLDTLQKMSGTTHRSFIDSKTVTVDKERIWMQNKGEVTYTMTTKEVPVISYNDMAFISERNSIVFRAGDSPVWNRNETILPMSWRLFKNTIVHAGHDYSLQTIPTLSSALDFDVRKNQPDFLAMLQKRLAQANISEEAQEKYKTAYGYTDYEMSQLDLDVVSDEVMLVINNKLRWQQMQENGGTGDGEMYDGPVYDTDTVSVNNQFAPSDIEDNVEVQEAVAKSMEEQKEWNVKRYAGKYLSKEDLVSKVSGVNHQLDADIVAVYTEIGASMQRDMAYFAMKPHDKGLYGVNGEPYITEAKDTDLQRLYEEDAKDPDKRVFSGIDEENMTDVQKQQFEREKMKFAGYIVHDEFYKFLVGLNRWDFARGMFESEMAKRMQSQ